tara:strand:- start:719 stop:1090 length:372 start_codon:yes stop_codon:yes gene_type:complete
MKLNNLRSIIQEELKKTLNEEYIDKYKVKGIIITDTTIRPQQEILSDIRSLTGVTIVSTVDLDGSYSQENNNLKVILNLKIDGYPFMKQGGFSREKIQDIINNVKRVEGVKSFIVNPQNITQM